MYRIAVSQEAYLEGVSCQSILESSRISKDIDSGKEFILLAESEEGSCRFCGYMFILLAGKGIM